jgi:hypothetical protein
MLNKEESIDYLEKQIPELARVAVEQAYWQSLKSGNSVVEVKNNALVETFPNGDQKFIKNLKPRIPVELGQKLKIK